MLEAICKQTIVVFMITFITAGCATSASKNKTKELEGQISLLSASIAAGDKEIAAKNDLLRQKDEQLAQKSTQLKEKDAKIAELKAKLKTFGVFE